MRVQGIVGHVDSHCQFALKQGWIHWGGGVNTPLALARGVQGGGGANFHIKYLNIKQLSLNKFTKLY